MAQSNNTHFKSDGLSTPPSVYGPEVSAVWKRTHNGQVIMRICMPLDTVDSELYVTPPKAIQGF